MIEEAKVIFIDDFFEILSDIYVPAFAVISELDIVLGKRTLLNSDKLSYFAASLDGNITLFSKDFAGGGSIGVTSEDFSEQTVLTVNIFGGDQSDFVRYERSVSGEKVNIYTAAGDDEILLDTDKFFAVNDFEIDTGSGNDNLTLFGISGVASGGSGNDEFILRQIAGATVDGGENNDLFKVSYESFGTIDGGIDVDTVDFSDNRNQLRDTGLPLRAPYEEGFISLLRNNGEIAVGFPETGNDEVLNLTSIERIIGTPNDDTVKFESVNAFGQFPNLRIDGGGGSNSVDFATLGENITAEDLESFNRLGIVGGVTFENFNRIDLTDNSNEWTTKGDIFYFRPEPEVPSNPNDPQNIPEGVDPTTTGSIDMSDDNNNLPDEPIDPKIEESIQFVLESTALEQGISGLTTAVNALTVLLDFDYATAGSFEEIYGGDGNDFIAANSGVFEIKGEEGNDLLIAKNAAFVPAQDAIPDNPDTEEDESRPAEAERRLTVDGGTGNDWIGTLGGTGAITVGGEGRISSSTLQSLVRFTAIQSMVWMLMVMNSFMKG